MAEIGDKIIVPTTGEEGFVVAKDKDFYYIATNKHNVVYLCDDVMIHPDNEALKELYRTMCD